MTDIIYASDLANRANEAVKALLLRCSHAENFLAMVALQKLPGEEGFPEQADFQGAYFDLVTEARTKVQLIINDQKELKP